MCRAPGVCLDFSSRIHPACPANKRTPGLREGDCPSEPLASPGRLMLHFSAWVWVLWPGWCMASTLYGMLAAGMWGCFLLVSILRKCCLRKDNMAVPFSCCFAKLRHGGHSYYISGLDGGGRLRATLGFRTRLQNPQHL